MPESIQKIAFFQEGNYGEVAEMLLHGRYERYAPRVTSLAFHSIFHQMQGRRVKVQLWQIEDFTTESATMISLSKSHLRGSHALIISPDCITSSTPTLWLNRVLEDLCLDHIRATNCPVYVVPYSLKNIATLSAGRLATLEKNLNDLKNYVSSRADIDIKLLPNLICSSNPKAAKIAFNTIIETIDASRQASNREEVAATLPLAAKPGLFQRIWARTFCGASHIQNERDAAEPLL
jgi:hypothetical protein